MNKLNLKRGSESRPATKVISVVSGKAGVGKTIVTFNLAERLASLGLKVLMVDADHDSGSLHILAHCARTSETLSLASHSVSLDEATTPVTDKIDLLASLWGRTIDEADEAALVINKLRQQATEYDIVLIDHGSGISTEMTVTAHASDINLLVMIPELASISDCYGLYKHLVSLNQDIDCRLLINRTVSGPEAEYLEKSFRELAGRFLNMAPAVCGRLIEDDNVRLSVAMQKPLAEVNPEGVAVQLLNSIAQSLAIDFRELSESGFKTFSREVNYQPATADIGNE